MQYGKLKMNYFKGNLAWKIIICSGSIAISVGILMWGMLTDKSPKTDRREMKWGDKIYSLYFQDEIACFVNYDEGKKEKNILLYDMETEETQELKHKINEFTNLCDICKGGNYYYTLEYTCNVEDVSLINELAEYCFSVEKDGKQDKIEEEYYIYKLDSEGKELSKKRIFRCCSESGEFSDLNIIHINVDKNGNLYTTDSSNRLKVFNNDMELILQIYEENMSLYELIQISDGSVAVSVINGRGESLIKGIDVKNGCFCDLCGGLNFANGKIIFGKTNENKLLYIDEGTLKCVDVVKKEGSGQDELVFELNMITNDIGSIRAVQQLRNGSYVLFQLSYDSEGRSSIIATKISAP